jgi:hypothetical protein
VIAGRARLHENTFTAKIMCRPGVHCDLGVEPKRDGVQVKGTHRSLKLVKRPQRRMMCVDIENVVGGAPRHSSQVEWAQGALVGAIDALPNEHVVIGVSHAGLLAVGTTWRGPRRILPPRSGPNGADFAILQVLAEENVADRYSELVLASGDGIFSETVAALAAVGLPVTVIAHRGRLSHRLRLAAATVIYLPYPPDDGPAASAAGEVA